MVANFLNGILSQGGSSNKENIYLAITPGVGLELAQIDPSTNTIVKYGSQPLEYNESLREIKSFSLLKDSILKLFEECKINPKSRVILSIPSVHIGKMELPIILTDEMITEALTSEVEQTYIFNKCEPVISWQEVFSQQSSDNRTIVYAAVQKPAIEAIKATLEEIGATLERVEISLISKLRAMSYLYSNNSIMADNTPWTLMMINSTGYELIQMNGKFITDYYSEPLALKTYEYEEVYEAINASAQIALMNYSVNNMIIMSNTDMIIAEHLASVIRVNGQVSYIENNNLKKHELMNVSLEILPDKVMQISMNAIGVAAIPFYEYPIKFNFAGSTKTSDSDKEPIILNIRGNRYELTEQVLYKIITLSTILALVPCLLLFAILHFSNNKIKSQLNDAKLRLDTLNSEYTQLNTENAPTTTSFDVNNEITTVLKNNRSKLINYSALGEAIPKRVWVTYFYTKDDGKIDIKGCSENVEDIYQFYKNLRNSLINSQIRLHKLDMQSNSVEAVMSSSANYIFEITNMDSSQLSTDNSSDSPKSSENDNNNNTDSNIKDLEEVEVN